MKNFEWATIDGRFNAAMEASKLRSKGFKKEAEELTEKVHEAIALYEDPKYYVYIDKKNKKLLLLYVSDDDSNEFYEFKKRHVDNFVCYVAIGCTWMHGMVVQQAEPTVTTKNYEKWRVFTNKNSQLWFEMM